MSARPVLDVSALPDTAFGHRSLMWWGTLGLMVIEGTVFGLAVAMYFYLRLRVKEWPPGVIPPALIYGSINTVILLVSAWPNHLVKKAAEREDLAGVRLWSTNAYGSVVWLLLGLHATHLVTDLGDTVVLAALMFIGPIQDKRFVDVSENAFYWYFVVLTWLPIYAVIYLVPRML
jgi:heme/copper-type cytochrome/quinol oxidase subunit 3